MRDITVLIILRLLQNAPYVQLSILRINVCEVLPEVLLTRNITLKQI